jgi:hypothetical protein
MTVPRAAIAPRSGLYAVHSIQVFTEKVKRNQKDQRLRMTVPREAIAPKVILTLLYCYDVICYVFEKSWCTTNCWVEFG